jgi:hypothetical protein
MLKIKELGVNHHPEVAVEVGHRATRKSAIPEVNRTGITG